MKRGAILIVSVVGILFLAVYIPQLIHETVQSRMMGQQYLVVLGDSVAAGAGLTNDGKRKADCNLSSTAFPFKLGRQLQNPVEQFACSGATVAATSSGTNNLASTQYGAAQQFLKGSNVVVYAGANDVGWLQIITSCTHSNCEHETNKQQLAQHLQILQRDLTAMLLHIQQSHPRRLAVNTYYDLLAPGDTCFSRFGITPEKAFFIKNEESQLNSAITTAATAANAVTVHIDFSGHTLCSANSWIQNVNERAPLHPTAAGQQQIATQDYQALH